MVLKRKTSKGIHYIAKVYLGKDAWGDPITKYGKARATKLEAQRDEVEIKENYGYDIQLSNVRTFNDLFAAYQKSSTWEGYSERTRKDYFYYWDKVIKPEFGSHEVAELRTAVLERWAFNMNKHVKRSAWNKPYSQLKAMVRFARKNGIINTDPFADADLPGETARGKALDTKSDLVTWTEEQVNAFMSSDVVKANYTLYAMLTLSFTYGLRPGEVCGIKCKNVTLRKLCIEQGIDNTGSETDLKTDLSHRELPMDPSVYNVLARLLVKHPDEYIFINQLGNVYTPNLYGKKWRKLLKSYNKQYDNVPVMPLYNTRHTFATLAVSVYGWQPRLVSAILGHTSTNTAEKNYINSTFTSIEEAYKTRKTS